MVLRRKHLSSDTGGRVDDQTTKFPLQVSHDAISLQTNRLLRFHCYLFGSCNGFLTLLFRETIPAGAHLIDQSLCLRIGFRQNLFVFCMRLGQLPLYVFSINLTLLDPAAPLLQHGYNRLESESLQNVVDDYKKHYLSNQIRPVNSELLRHII